MFDPTELLAIGATTAGISAVGSPLAGGVIGAGLLARRAYRTGRAFKLGAAAGAIEATTFEALRAKMRYDVDGGDVLLAGLLGGTIGGTIGGVTKKVARRAKIHELSEKVASGGVLTPAEGIFYDENNVDNLTQRIFDEVERRGDLEDADSTPVPRSVGELTAEKARKTSKQLAGGFLTPLRKRLSVYVRTKNSANGFVRAAADRLGLNSSGNADRTIVEASASERKALLEHKFRSRFARSLFVNRKKWAKRTGGEYADFNVLVSRAIRGGVENVADPDVRKAAQEVIDAERELGQLAIDYNVAGFTPGILDNQRNYLPRLFSDTRIASIRQKFGDKANTVVATLVERAIRQAQPNIESALSEKDISRMARGYAKTIMSPRYTKAHRSFEFTMEDLKTVLKDEELDEESINKIIDNLTRSTSVKAHNRARPRLLLDETSFIDVKMDDGSVETIRFTDLLEEDIESLHNAYIFQMSGAIGLARNGINTNDVGSSFEALKDKIRKEAEITGQSSSEMEEEIRALEFMYDGITGRLAFKEGQPSFNQRQTMRRIKEGSFIIHMGMSGMAALMELTNVLMEYSIPVLLRAMPQYRGLIKKASDGKLDNNLLRELEELTGLGTDVVTGKFTRTSRFEGETFDITDDAGIEKVDEYLGRGREAMSLLSGLSPITAGLRRLSMLNYSTAWARAARKGDNPFSDIKMEQLGIDKNMAEAIRQQIKIHATYRNADGTIIDSLNTKNWPKDVQEAFQISVYREATQSVQEVSLGSINPTLRGAWGQVIFQFLSFPIAAMEQQAMRIGVRAFNGDAISAAKILTSAAFMGSLMYTMRVYINAEGRSDKEEYIKRQLTPERLVSGALGQIGATSTFAMIYDMTTGAMDGNNYALTPASFSLLQKGLQTGKALQEGVSEMSETEIRQGLRLAPFSSLYGVRNILNYAANQWAN